MKNAVLVTGGAGYIGSHTCKELHARGYYPVTLDNLIYGHEQSVRWGPLIQGDIMDSTLLDQLFQQYNPVAVIHFAAYAYVGESVQDPGKYYHNNVGGTITLLEVMRRNHCRHFVFSSSCATYGLPKTLPITEESSQNPINPYGKSKLMVEEMLKDYDRAYGLKSFCLRYFNASGANLEGALGEDHDPETHAIPLAIHNVLGITPEFKVFGTDYPTADGSAIRDYVHVDDLADAHVRAVEFLKDKGASLAVNLGSGRGISVFDIIKEVQLVSKRTINAVHEGRRPGDPPVLVADATLAQKVLGWNPSRSDLNTIISSAWAWHASRHAQLNSSL